jgi:hypothetical protein
MARPILVKAKITILAVVVLILSNILVTQLTMESFRNICLDTIVAANSVQLLHFEHKIENELRFGKPLAKLYGLDTMMLEARKRNPDLSDIRLFKPDRDVLFSFEKDLIGQPVPPATVVDYTEWTWMGRNLVRVAGFDHDIHVQAPIRNPLGQWIGTLDFVFPRSRLEDKADDILTGDQSIPLLTAILAGLVLVLLVPVVARVRPGQPLAGKILIPAVLVVIALSQAFYLGFTTLRFKDSYEATSRTNIAALEDWVRADVEAILDKSVRLDRLKKIDQYLSEFTMAIPEINVMAILDAQNRVVYAADKLGVVSADKFAELNLPRQHPMMVDVSLRKTDPAGSSVGQGWIRTWLSEKVMGQGVWKIHLHSLAFFILGLHFSGELFLFLLLAVQWTRPEKDPALRNARLFNAMLARLAAFVYLPLVMLPALLLPTPGIWARASISDILTALPFSLPILAEAGAALAGALILGLWGKRGGEQPPILIGLVLVGAGHFWCLNATGETEYLVYRALTGLGYGMVWASAWERIFSFSLPTTQSVGILGRTFSQMSAHVTGLTAGYLAAQNTDTLPIILILACLVVTPIGFFVHALVRPKTKAGPLARSKANGPVRSSGAVGGRASTP